MFWAILCPSSGACDYDVDYHIGRIILGLLYVGAYVQLGWSGVWVAGSSLSLQPLHHSSLTATNLQHTANQECGNQHHSHELLMMGIVLPRTC